MSIIYDLCDREEIDILTTVCLEEEGSWCPYGRIENTPESIFINCKYSQRG